jgi:hypothetical protein
MKSRGLRQLLVCWVAIVGAVFVFAADASAIPQGLVAIDSGSAFVTVTATSIDWAPPGGGTGTFTTGGTTNFTFTGGSLTPGVPGTLRDLTSAPPVLNFMTFASAPTLAFDLLSVGPGLANTNCAGLADGASCSIFAGSPIVLTKSGIASTVTLNVSGTVHDSAGTSNWSGLFTTQLPDMTPGQVQALFAGNPQAAISSTYSAAFVATVVPTPEPTSLGLLSLGLVTLAAYRRKRV